MKEKTDIYEKITAQIIEAIEVGYGKFELPWHTFGVLPTNASNNRRYRGVNMLALWAVASHRGYNTNLWATYQQWHELGAQVRRGEKSATVVFWKFYDEDRESEDDATPEGNGRHYFARAYHVFNADQVDGFTVPEMPTLPEGQRIQRAEDFFRNTGIRIVEKAHEPAMIRNPMRFTCRRSRYSKKRITFTALSGMRLSTRCAPSRCNRQLSNRFGSELYAAEELVAELGSAFLSAELQLETEPKIENAPYCESWLKVLKSDKRAIFTAASKAQQAVDWLLNRQIREQAA